MYSKVAKHVITHLPAALPIPAIIQTVPNRGELCPLRCREDAFFEAGVVLWLFSSHSTFLGVWFVFNSCRTVGVRSGWRVVKSIWWIGGRRRCGAAFHGFRFLLFTDTPFCCFILLLYSERLLVVIPPRWQLSLFFYFGETCLLMTVSNMTL